MLSHFLSNLSGTRTECAEAAALLRMSVEQNYEEAQVMMGMLCLNGSGDENLGEGLRWFKLAAAQGLGAALYVADKTRHSLVLS